MPVIPVYQPRVSAQAVPGVRVDAGGGFTPQIGEALQRIGGTIAATGAEVLDRVRARQEADRRQADVQAAQLAVAGFNEASVRFVNDMRTNLGGVKAAGAPAAFEDWYKTRSEETLAGLSDEARKRASVFLAQSRGHLVESVLAHVDSEGAKARRQTGLALRKAGVDGVVSAVSEEGRQGAAAAYLAWLNDTATAEGWAPEARQEEERGFWADATTRRLDGMHAGLLAAPLAEEVDAEEQRMLEVTAEGEQAGRLSQDAAAQWRKQIGAAAEARREGFEREETDRQRTNVRAWQNKVFGLLEKGAPELGDWLESGQTIEEANPQFVDQVVQTRMAVRKALAEDKADVTEADRSRAAADLQDVETRLDIVVAMAKSGKLTPDQARTAVERVWRDAPESSLELNKAYEEADAALASLKPSDASHAGVWEEFNRQAATGRYGSAIVRKGEDITKKVLLQAREKAGKAKTAEKRTEMASEVDKAEQGMMRLYSLAKWFTELYLSEQGGKPVRLDQYQAAMSTFMGQELTRRAEAEALEAAGKLSELGE